MQTRTSKSKSVQVASAAVVVALLACVYETFEALRGRVADGWLLAFLLGLSLFTVGLAVVLCARQQGQYLRTQTGLAAVGGSLWAAWAAQGVLNITPSEAPLGIAAVVALVLAVTAGSRVLLAVGLALLGVWIACLVDGLFGVSWSRVDQVPYLPRPENLMLLAPVCALLMQTTWAKTRPSVTHTLSFWMVGSLMLPMLLLASGDYSSHWPVPHAWVVGIYQFVGLIGSVALICFGAYAARAYAVNAGLVFLALFGWKSLPGLLPDGVSPVFFYLLAAAAAAGFWWLLRRVRPRIGPSDEIEVGLAPLAFWRFTSLAVAAVVLFHAGLWSAAAYNRWGTPDSVLTLTQREVEWDGSALKVSWLVRPTQEGAMWNTPGVGDRAAWLDHRKLSELGFAMAPPKSTGTQRLVDGQPGRTVVLVLELDAVAGHLRAVDAGLDAATLRARYTDRTRYALLPGKVDAWNAYESKTSDMTIGWVQPLPIKRVHVPAALAVALHGQPAFSLQVNFGRRLEPWVSLPSNF